MRKLKHIHFIGIGGIGMSGLAEMVMSLGYSVSGSDLVMNDSTRRLQALGAKIYAAHDAANIVDCDLVVITGIIKDHNPELRAAKERGISIIHRAKLLGELMQRQRGIAVSGSHGKTTTTSLIASVLLATGKSPSFAIGGKLLATGLNAALGSGEVLVAEADESDASFLYLKPTIVVITNINAEHLTFFKNDFELLKQAFVDFINSVPFYGVAVLCLDCPIICELLPKITANVITYGFNQDADYVVTNFVQHGTRSTFTVLMPGNNSIEVLLNLPGKHNAVNALAALIVAREEHVPEPIILSALAKFSGVGRRFEVQGDLTCSFGKVTFIDDYGHHPRELQATIAAVYASWPGQRLVMVFQPHKYTRTRDLFSDFVEVLAKVDQVVLLEVYAASEDYIEGADSEALATSLMQKYHKHAVLVRDNKDLAAVLTNVLQDGDICLMQGAGSVWTLSQKVRNEFKQVALMQTSNQMLEAGINP